MSVSFYRRGMAALHLPAPVLKSSFVRRLLATRGDPAKARIVARLIDTDDARLSGFGFTREDIVLLRRVARHRSAPASSAGVTGNRERTDWAWARIPRLALGATQARELEIDAKLPMPIGDAILRARNGAPTRGPCGCWHRHNLTSTARETIMSTTILSPAAMRRQSRSNRLIATLKTWWTTYLVRQIERATIIQLHAMSDRQLHNIGLTRSRIEWAVRGERDCRFSTRDW